MSRAPVLVLLVVLLGACAIDARKVKVSGACVTPPAGGLISDFSAARRGIVRRGSAPPSWSASPRCHSAWRT